MPYDTALAGAIAPPAGVTPNLQHPPDAGWTLNVVLTVLCTVLLGFFFAARWLAKCATGQRLLAEDWTCTIAWALTLVFIVSIFQMARHGEGYHAWDVTRSDYNEVLKWVYISSVVYCPAAYFTKTTLLLIIARVFAVNTSVNRGIHIFIWSLLISYVPVQVIKTLSCIPVRAYWEEDVPGAHCFDERKVFIADLTLALVTDLIILILPVCLAWSLRMSLHRKLKVMFLLGAGGAAISVIAVRIYKVAMFEHSNDVTADVVSIGLTTLTELTIGVVCACLPLSNLFVERFMRNRTARRQAKSSCKMRASTTLNTTSVADCRPTTASLPMNMTMLSRDAPICAEDLFGPCTIEPYYTGQGLTSHDGLREGWLSSVPVVGESAAGRPGPSRLLSLPPQLLLRTPSEILVPDRIWDGVQRQ